MKGHQPLGDAVRVNAHVAHRGGAHTDMLVPDVKPRQIRHFGLAALPDRGGYVWHAPFVHLFSAVEDRHAIVSGLNLAYVKGQEHAW